MRKARLGSRLQELGKLEALDESTLDPAMQALRNSLMCVAETQVVQQEVLAELVAGQKRILVALQAPRPVMRQPRFGVAPPSGAGPSVTPSPVGPSFSPMFGMPPPGGYVATSGRVLSVSVVSSTTVVTTVPLSSQAEAQTLEEFVRFVYNRWHDPQGAQKAIDTINSPGAKRYKNVRELTDTVERLLVVPGVRYDQQVLTAYLRCLPSEVRTKLVDEAYVEQHNFTSCSKKALDIEAKLGSAHQSQGDGRKKRLPQNWKKKGQLMFVDHDGQTTEIDEFPNLGDETEHDGAGETSDGGVVAPIKEKARGTAKKKHAMNMIFHDYLDKFIVVYLDDILIVSGTVEDHIEHLKIVLGLLRQHQYKVIFEKCEFDCSKILYLGHEISAEGLRPDDAKVASMGLVLFGSSDIMKRLVHIMHDENDSHTITITASERALSQSCNRVPSSVVCNFILLQMVCIIIFFAISRTSWSVISMLLLVVLLILRQWILSRAFCPDDLEYLDRPALYFHLGVDSPNAGYADINNPVLEPSPLGILSPPVDHPGHGFDGGTASYQNAAPVQDALASGTAHSSHSVPLMSASEYYSHQRLERVRESRPRRTAGHSTKRRRITHPDPDIGSTITSGVRSQFAVTPDGDPGDVQGSTRVHIRALRRRIRKNRKFSHGIAKSANRAHSWEFPISNGAPGWSPYSSEELRNVCDPLRQRRFAHSVAHHTSKVFQLHSPSAPSSARKVVLTPAGGPGMTATPAVTGDPHYQAEDAEETVIKQKRTQQEKEAEGIRGPCGPQYVSEIDVLTKKLTPKHPAEKDGKQVADRSSGLEGQLADDVDSYGRGWYTNVLYEPRRPMRRLDSSPQSPTTLLPDSGEEFVYYCPLYKSDPNALSLSYGSASSCGEEGGSGSLRSNLGGSLSHAEIFLKDMLRWDGEDESSSHSARWSQHQLRQYPSPQSCNMSASPGEDGQNHLTLPGIDSGSEMDGLHPDEQHTWATRYSPSPLGRAPSSGPILSNRPQSQSSSAPRASSPLRRASSPHMRVQSPRGQSPSPLARAVLSRSPGGSGTRLPPKAKVSAAGMDRSRLWTYSPTVQGGEQASRSSAVPCQGANVAEKEEDSVGESPKPSWWKPPAKPSLDFVMKSLNPPPIRIRLADSLGSAVVDPPELAADFRLSPSQRTQDVDESVGFEVRSCLGGQTPVCSTLSTPHHTAIARNSHMSGFTFPMRERKQGSAPAVPLGHEVHSQSIQAKKSRLAHEHGHIEESILIMDQLVGRDSEVPLSAQGWRTCQPVKEGLVEDSTQPLFLPACKKRGKEALCG
ncbi:hypothetical protein CBR_g66740 [Chara braunii]|uniref:Reverse transcriptase domain-containing protein n=1 Tax=Chara braunii TaxID=69332 RepID=A0A388JQ52_CHABU|nr:hypothetical protein CBR_g66740 [Chara braunii]|eukprot:GBG59934.1 hypothetical protein CBR_g66740 [Chara braunii]